MRVPLTVVNANSLSSTAVDMDDVSDGDGVVYDSALDKLIAKPILEITDDPQTLSDDATFTTGLRIGDDGTLMQSMRFGTNTTSVTVMPSMVVQVNFNITLLNTNNLLFVTVEGNVEAMSTVTYTSQSTGTQHVINIRNLSTTTSLVNPTIHYVIIEV